MLNTLNSVVRQSYRDIDIVIVDDGSKDRSVDIIKSIKDIRIRIISQENRGVSAARNEGVRNAKGDWIMFLDADDILEPDAIRLLILAERSNVGIIAGKFFLQTENGGCIIPSNNIHYGFVCGTSIYRNLIQNTLIIRAGSYIIKKEIVEKHFFNKDLKRMEDAESFLKWIKETSIYVIDEDIMTYQTEYADLSKVNEDNWEGDFGFYLDFKNSSFWEKLYLGTILKSTYNSYPSHKLKLDYKYRRYKIYIVLSGLIQLFQRVVNKLNRTVHV